MSTEPFKLIYDGPALRDGLMDARDLSQALLALGEVITRVNYLQNGDSATVTLRIRAADERGSFPAILELFQELPRSLIGFEAVSPRTILEYIGLASAAVASEPGLIGNLIDLWKLLRGTKATVVETDSETNTATIDVAGEKNHVNQVVLNLYGDMHIHRHFPQVLDPLRSPGVESLEAVHAGESVWKLSRDDAKDIVSTRWETDDVAERIDEVKAEIITPQFRDGYKWRFFSSLLGKFTANMMDKSFLSSLESSGERFGYGDWLHFQMRTRTVETDEEKSVERDIVKVIEIIRSPRQTSLDV